MLEDRWREGGFEGLGAEFGFDVFNVSWGDDVDAAEGALVLEDDDAIVGEAEPKPGGVRAEAVVGEDVEVARHAEVDVKGEAV